MAKYKVGDKVRIVSEMPCDSDFDLEMRMFLGKEFTISKVKEWGGTPHYYSEEATPKDLFAKTLFNILGVPGYYFRENWIAGLAEPKRNDNGLSVVIRFSGNKTTARLMRGDTIVKTAFARRNPADKYSHAKGASLAVERLFEKKKTEAEKLEAAKAHCRRAAAYKSALPKKLGDKFVVKADCYRKISPGTIVTLISPPDNCGVNRYGWKRDGKWDTQLISDDDLEPYWG